LSKYKAEIILFAVATIWAGTFPMLKVTLAEFPPFYFVGFRFAIAAVLFTIIFFRKFSFSGFEEFRAGIILGLLLITGFTSQAVGLVYTSSSNSALITGVNVLVVPFAQYVITRKKVFIENWIGVLLVTIGLFLLTRPELNGINAGDWITLICAVSWAFYIIYLDVFTNRSYNIYVLILIQFWLVTVISLLIGLAFEDASKISFSGNNIAAMLYTAILSTLVATTLGNKYQKFTSPIRATLVLAWETPAAVIMSLIFLNEQFKFIQITGAVIMVGGILFSETFEYIKMIFIKEKDAEEMS
jgi:drug/metabolite transporter (DMT)-like permease